MCGVEGVREDGNEVLDELLGGVCDRVGSCIVVECEEGSRVGSGERFGGVGCGIVLSKISARSSVEKVRFASSAARLISSCEEMHRNFPAYSFGNGALHGESVFFASRGLLGSLRRVVN